jgi:hypothetical protein
VYLFLSPLLCYTANIDPKDNPMSAAIFDTHALVKNLQTKGFQVEQAEGITDALKEALTVAEVATKHDIGELRDTTQLDIRELRDTTQLDIRELREAMQTDIRELREAMQTDIRELREAMQTDIKTLESQIRELRFEFKAEIANIRTEFKTEIANIRTEIAPLKWGMGLCAAGILSLVFKAFF